MSQVVSLTYSPFAENTYLIYDDTRECVIIDPGCYTREEEKHLVHTIELHRLKPVRLLNTHGHIDHSGDLARMNLEFSKPIKLMIPYQIESEVKNMIQSYYKLNNCFRVYNYEYEL